MPQSSPLKCFLISCANYCLFEIILDMEKVLKGLLYLCFSMEEESLEIFQQSESVGRKVNVPFCRNTGSDQNLVIWCSEVEP